MVHKPLDSKDFSKADLDAILNAFYDVADTIDTNDFASNTGVTDTSSRFGSATKSKDNFTNARNIIYKK